MSEHEDMHDDERDERDDEFSGEDQGADAGEMEHVVPVRGMYNDYFLDYASYVILERAVPHQHDGLKPVQRRILHSCERWTTAVSTRWPTSSATR